MTEIFINHEGNKIKTAQLSWLPLEYLCFNLSDADRLELFGQSPSTNPLAIAHNIMHASKGLAWCVWVNGRPTGALGVFELHPGVWHFWALGADNPAIALAMVGPLFEQVLPHVREHGGHRIECKARVDRKGNHDRLRLLGFRPEGVLHFFGTDKSHYLQFAYILAAEEPEIETVLPPIIPAVEGVQPAAPAA